MPILPQFHPDDFSASTLVDNPYFPLGPGQIRAYRAETEPDEEGEITVETHDAFVTFETRNVAGVEAVVVRDTAYENGVLVEDTFDWYAQDDAGNVWYLGEQVYNYRYDDDGTYVSTDFAGSFEAGVDGAQGGYKMPAEPGYGAGYYQEFAPGIAVDEGIVVGTGEEALTGAARYTDAVKILDTTALEPDVAEFKYYAPGVGEVLVEEDLDETGEPGLVVELETLRDVAPEAARGSDGGARAIGVLEDGVGVGDATATSDPEPGDLAGDGELFLTFLGGQARFESTIGAYTVDLATGTLGEARILIENTRETEIGSTVAIEVEEGEALGLFLVPDGAAGGLDFSAYEDGGLFFVDPTSGGAATLGDRLAPLVTDAGGTALPVKALHALGNENGFNFLNPAAGVQAIELESMLLDGRHEDLEGVELLGFEDRIATDRDRDSDFNDVLLAVSPDVLPADLLPAFPEPAAAEMLIG